MAGRNRAKPAARRPSAPRAAAPTIEVIENPEALNGADPTPMTPAHRVAAMQAQFLCSVHDALAMRLARSLVALGVLTPTGVEPFVQNECNTVNAGLQQVAAQALAGGETVQ